MLHRSTGLTYTQTDKSQIGYTLMAPFASKLAFLVNPQGEVVHRWTGSHSVTHACYLLENGNLWINELSDAPKGVPLTTSGLIRERDSSGHIVWEHHDPWQHHDARRLPHGGAIYIAYKEPDIGTASAFSGGVPDSEPDGGMFGECIKEIDAEGQLLKEWSTNLLPENFRRLHRNANRWSAGHLNTIQPLANGTVLACSKTLNLTFLLQWQTGELLWHYQSDMLGGPHDAQMLENGNVLIFANGLYAADLHHSQVWEIDPNTNEIVWRFHQRDNPMQFYSPHIGGCQRLPGGNTLICEGSHGCVFEVSKDGDIVWEYVNPECGFHEFFGHANWLFRARSYPLGAPELQGIPTLAD